MTGGNRTLSRIHLALFHSTACAPWHRCSVVIRQKPATGNVLHIAYRVVNVQMQCTHHDYNILCGKPRDWTLARGASQFGGEFQTLRRDRQIPVRDLAIPPEQCRVISPQTKIHPEEWDAPGRMKDGSVPHLGITSDVQIVLLCNFANWDAPGRICL